MRQATIAKAAAVLHEGRIIEVKDADVYSQDLELREFHVSRPGSGGVHVVLVVASPFGHAVLCDCTAGKHDQQCNHGLAVLGHVLGIEPNGDTTARLADAASGNGA